MAGLSDLHYRQGQPEPEHEPVLVMNPDQVQAFVASQADLLKELFAQQNAVIRSVTHTPEDLLQRLFADHHRMMGEITKALGALTRRLEKMDDPTISVPVPEVHPHVQVEPSDPKVTVMPAQRERLTVKRDLDRGFITEIIKEPS